MSSFSSSSPSRDALRQEKIATLKSEIEQLNDQLGGEDPEEIVKGRAAILQEYRERKNATQIMISKLAELERVSANEIRERLGLDPKD